MVKKEIDPKIEELIERYVKKVGEKYKIDGVYLFGSFAKGSQHKDSDIDIAIISSDVNDRIGDMGKMFAMTWDIDTRIEPYPINTKNFNINENAVVYNIIKNGIRFI